MSQETETPTPRTDHAIAEIFRCADGAMDLQRFTRQLETELASLQSDVRRLVGQLGVIRVNARAIQNIRYGPDGDCGACRLANFIEEDAERLALDLANNPSLKPE